MADQTFTPKRQAALTANLEKAKTGEITRKDVTDSLRKVESDQFRKAVFAKLAAEGKLKKRDKK